MAKRIVSGIFTLTALGALGVILAGALTSGEQLIVRFLTAVTVAALGLYVISDLRIRNEEPEALPAADSEKLRRRASGGTGEAVPTYMGTVTGDHHDQGRHPGPGHAVGSTFEAIEPVTGAPAVSTFEVIEPITGSAPPADRQWSQPQNLTNSRLIPSTTTDGPDNPRRTLPPHPNTARPRTVTGNEAPTEPFAGEPLLGLALAGSLDDTAPLPTLHQAHPVAQHESVEFAPDDNDGGPPSDRPDHDVVSSTTFTYAGPLKAENVEWPPRPDQRAGATTADVTPHQRFDVASSDGVDTLDVPLGDIMAVDGLDDLDGHHEPDDEYGPVTVDELLGTPDRSPSAPLSVVPADRDRGDTVGRRDDDIPSPVQAEHDPAQRDGDDALLADEAPVAADDTVGVGVGDQDDATAAPRRPQLTLITSDATTRRIEAAEWAAPATPALPDLHSNQPDDVGSRPEPDHAPAAHGSAADDDRLTAAIRSGELQVIKTLIQQGMLSTAGPITDRDVRTMVYVAFTSNELRKLIRSGGTPDRIRAGDLDLGPVELFDESRYAPLPKRVYDPSTARLQPRSVDSSAATASEPTATIDLDSAGGATHSPPAIIDVDRGAVETTPPLPPLPTPKHLYRKSGDMVTES